MADRIVFLDFDGVINKGAGRFLRELVEQLNRITDRTGAKIVVHSSWRWHYPLEDLRKFLQEHHEGLPVTGEIIDACLTPDKLRQFITPQTPRESRRDRPLAIQVWLDQHPEVTQYIILDDSPNLGHFVGTSNFIRTRHTEGLTRQQADRAILTLKGVTW